MKSLGIMDMVALSGRLFTEDVNGKLSPLSLHRKAQSRLEARMDLVAGMCAGGPFASWRNLIVRVAGLSEDIEGAGSDLEIAMAIEGFLSEGAVTESTTESQEDPLESIFSDNPGWEDGLFFSDEDPKYGSGRRP